MTLMKYYRPTSSGGATDHAYNQSSVSTTSNASLSPFFSLVPAVIEDSGTLAAHEAMEIALPGGVRLRIASASHIALAVALIRQLEAAKPC